LNIKISTLSSASQFATIVHIFFAFSKSASNFVAGKKTRTAGCDISRSIRKSTENTQL